MDGIDTIEPEFSENSVVLPILSSTIVGYFKESSQISGIGVVNLHRYFI
jgi:hypothetical protein